jgi:recombinational DNA repair ATPase RecF
MKEGTGKRLMQTITYYDQKRAALEEELRNPRLRLTTKETRTMIAIFEARIEKRARQIIELNKSMPTHADHERYKTSDGGWYGTEYERNEAYDQNRRMTSHGNTQRDAIMKELDASIARLDRQGRTVKTRLAAATDPVQRQTLTDELAKTEALIAERRQQLLGTLKPSATATHPVGLKEATDMDKAMQTAIGELSREFTTLFQRYNTFLNELSTLHAAEAALAAKSGHPGEESGSSR